MDNNLNDMLKHIVNGDEENAGAAFHSYVKEKMRSMVAGGEPAAPAVKPAEPTPTDED